MNGFVLIYFAITAAIVAAWWVLFGKAGQARWKSLVPIYSFLVLLRIVGRKWWWLLLAFVPVVGVVIWIVVALDLATSFGRGTGFGLGLAFLPFVFGPILAFGGSSYRGPASQLAR